MTCAQGLLRLLWGGDRSWSATGLAVQYNRTLAKPGPIALCNGSDTWSCLYMQGAGDQFVK